MTDRLVTTAGALVEVDQGESLTLTVNLKDEAGAVVDPAGVTTLTLTLRDEATQAIINNRLNDDIQNANGATISNNVLTIRLDALDNVLVGTADEYHVAIIEFTWNDGTTVRTGIGEVRFLVHASSVADSVPTVTEKIDLLMASPRRVTTDEGTVVERSVDELIKAKNNLAADDVGDGPFHGLRVSRCKGGPATW